MVIATILNVYLAFKKHSQQKPVIDIKVENLPPYKTINDKTTIILKNVGNKDSDGDLEILIICSWITSVSYKLELPDAGGFLAPNEEMKWKIRLNDELTGNSSIKVLATNPISKNTWSYVEQIS